MLFSAGGDWGGLQVGGEWGADAAGVCAARAQTLLLLFSVDDLTGFEITKLVELPDPWGIVVVWGLVLPLTYIVSSSLTNLVLSDFLILKARIFFPAHGLPGDEEEEGGFRV